ncbi:MAG: tRNA (N(6)-L-threonylcarbamoyladenosine(37)-C(2))-methylthiotransferase MtaB [Bacteroidia bacterium]|nr:tRNA (N(6)-L-threonylcarbamoyladenosine(37)-C(2))-methylthiotransferase MtaB [Bacteroidia bacterium]
MNRSVAFYTLGCKLNYSESSSLNQQLEKIGYVSKDFTEGPDVYVINTCSVTDHADKKCKKIVREALKYNPDAFVAVIGCYAQLKPGEIATIEGVDLVLGAAEKFNLMNYLNDITKKEKAEVAHSNIKKVQDFVPGFSGDDRTRSFLKVQDGCDYFCSFCTIPLARGSSRSLDVQDTLRVAKELAATDVKEVVLTGCNLGDFGVNHNESFLDLIKELDKVEGIERYRISSIEPNLLTDDIIAFVASSNKFLPHFHIPLQSGSNTILKSMRRRYMSELYEEKITKIKSAMPDCAIGVDVIVGFPGESHEEFLKTYEFLNRLNVSYFHVFPYSERPNTTAWKMTDIVPVKTRGERTKQLMNLSEKKRQFFYRENLGKTYPVLFEKEERAGKMYGFTPNYIRVEADYDPMLINEIVDVKLLSVDPESMHVLGEVSEYAATALKLM